MQLLTRISNVNFVAGALVLAISLGLENRAAGSSVEPLRSQLMFIGLAFLAGGLVLRFVNRKVLTFLGYALFAFMIAFLLFKAFGN